MNCASPIIKDLDGLLGMAGKIDSSHVILFVERGWVVWLRHRHLNLKEIRAARDVSQVV